MLPMRRALPLLLLGLAACGGDEPSPGDRPNVLLITVDTLRADRLGFMGYGRTTSPAMDELAERGVIFERAYAPSPWTLPSMASIHTGLYPSSHGLKRPQDAIPPEARTLAEVLSQAGYRTDSIVSNPLVHPRFGHSQGFGSFDTEDAKGHEHVSTPGITERALALLDQYAVDEPREQPFFLSLLYFDPHYDWRSHGLGFASDQPVGRITGEETIEHLRDLAGGAGGLSEGEVRQLVDCYDEEIAFTDQGIGELLDALERLGLADNTIVVLTADHGEEFLEHGWLGHTRFLYEGMVHVPMVVCDPRDEDTHGMRYSEPVSTVSVMPTVLDLVGLDPELHGPDEPSLAQIVREPLAKDIDPRIDGVVFSEVDFVPAQEKNLAKVAHLIGVVGADGKLVRDIETGALELFDLLLDPGEQVNLAADPGRREGRRELRQDLEAWQAACANSGSSRYWAIQATASMVRTVDARCRAHRLSSAVWANFMAFWSIFNVSASSRSLLSDTTRMYARRAIRR